MGIEHASPFMLLILVLMVLPVGYFIYLARKGKNFYVRRIPGVDAIEEAIGRSAELGRPLSFSTGLTSVGPVLYACLGVLSHIAGRVARYKSRLIVPQNDPEAMAIVEDVVRESYRAAGRSSAFDPQSIVFLSNSQFAFASGYMGLIHRENVASAFLFGTFAAESLILAEAGQQVGAMQVGASIEPSQVAFFICACDYTLIGEELYASSSYLSREPVQLGSLCGQDRAKLLFVLIIVIGSLVATWNNIWPENPIVKIDSLINYSWAELYQLWKGL